MKAGNLKHLYRYNLEKDCFAHDAAYSDSKDIEKRFTKKCHRYFYQICMG